MSDGESVYIHSGFEHDIAIAYCVACSTRNFSCNFPVCTLCGNAASEEAEDGHEVLENAVKELGIRMSAYLNEEQELVQRRGDKFILKDHLIKLAVDFGEKKRRKEEKKRLEALKAGKIIAGENDSTNSEISGSKATGVASGKSGASGVTSSNSTNASTNMTAKKKKIPTNANIKNVKFDTKIKKHIITRYYCVSINTFRYTSNHFF